MELEEAVKVLNIGDRIRVLCDDGVVVAEKVSETQFELIHYQMISDSIH
jgi:TusA-related sulfurtransferase